MSSSRLLAAALLAALAACAPSQPGETTRPGEAKRSGAQPLAGEIVRAGCRQGQCSWLRIIAADPVGTPDEGELRRITVRRGVSLHQGGGDFPTDPAGVAIEWEEKDQAEYAFCSVRRPAYAFPGDDGGLVVHFLDLFQLSGYQYPSAALYMAFCHRRLGTGRAAEPAEPEALRALGYKPGTRSEQIEAEGPDVMTRF
jgi:hypothetical protein